MYYKSIFTQISIYECENTNSGIQKLSSFSMWEKKYANERKKKIFFSVDKRFQ